MYIFIDFFIICALKLLPVPGLPIIIKGILVRIETNNKNFRCRVDEKNKINVFVIKSFDMEINDYENALNKLKEDIDKIQIGEDNSPYWNGDLAYGWIKSALAHLDHDRVLGDNLKECLEYLSDLNKKTFFQLF